jgi:hypothetical protein
MVTNGTALVVDHAHPAGADTVTVNSSPAAATGSLGVLPTVKVQTEGEMGVGCDGVDAPHATASARTRLALKGVPNPGTLIMIPCGPSGVRPRLV